MNLYELSEQYQRLMEVEEWTKDHDAMLDEISDNLSAKVESCCKAKAMLEGEIEKFKAEEKRIAARRKQLENNAQRLKDYMQSCLEQASIDKMDAGTFSVRLQANNKSVQILDESLIPEEFFVEQEPTLSKKDISEAFRSGQDVPGCEFKSSGFSLRIK